MRFWKNIWEGLKRDRGVTGRGRSRRGGGWISQEGEREGGGDSGDEGGVAIGFDRKDVFLRRTGPGAESPLGSGIRERSAISHGLACSGALSSAEIQGSWSKTWRDGRSTRV